MSNVGAWLKNGITWYVWDVVTGAYIPEVIESQSLKYIAQAAAPDPTKYTFWIKLDGGGVAQSIQYYSGGTWNDVYASTFANIYTKAQTDAAIAAAFANVVTGKGAFRAIATSNQDIAFVAPAETIVQVVFGLEQYDPDSVFAANAFTCPATGFYSFKTSVYLGVTVGSPTGNSISVNIRVNGTPVQLQLYDDSAAGARVYSFGADLPLNVGDIVDVSADVTVGGGTPATWTISPVAGAVSFSGYRVR